MIVGKLVLVLMLFGWPSIARLMRSSVLQVKPNDYVQAARALGAQPARIILSHILPNALAPVIVVATINLGGLHRRGGDPVLPRASVWSRPAISWGVGITAAADTVARTAHILLFPCCS